MLGHRRGGHEVERTGPEAVVGAGERTDRADLDRVAREVGVERLAVLVEPVRRETGVLARGADADLLAGSALDQRDEGVTGDLLGEAGAPRAQDAALAVEQDLLGDDVRLGEGALGLDEARLAATVAHGLVLQRALAALVADRAVEGVVEQQELHGPVLRLLGDRRGDLGLDDHARRDLEGAGRLRLGEAAAVPGVGDLHQALAARTHGLEQRVVAEARDLHAHQLGRPDHQAALGDADLDVVDRQRDELDRRLRRVGFGHRHARASSGSSSVAVMPAPPRGRASMRPAGRARPTRCACLPRTPRGSTRWPR